MKAEPKTGEIFEIKEEEDKVQFQALKAMAISFFKDMRRKTSQLIRRTALSKLN